MIITTIMLVISPVTKVSASFMTGLTGLSRCNLKFFALLDAQAIAKALFHVVTCDHLLVLLDISKAPRILFALELFRPEELNNDGSTPALMPLFGFIASLP